jgi:hypothetical protein
MICNDCGQDIDETRFLSHVSPSAFTTSFEPRPVDESEEMFSFRRVVAIEANEIIVTPCAGTNTRIGTSGKAYVLRLNEGLSEGSSDPIPFTLVPVDQNKVWVAKGISWRFPDQMLLKKEYEKRVASGRVGGGGDPVTVRLMSRKTTDALFLTPVSLPSSIDLGRIGRRIGDTGVRAALVSATHLLVQRAALELDLDPEEFDVLEPRVRSGLPVLQIADNLPNGAGFSRRLAEGDPALIVSLVRSMLDTPNEDRLVSGYLTKDHRERCKAACYGCLQRYGNRSYHGLLDWRLGLSALRLFIDGTWTAGLDGAWNEAFEIQDWLEDAIILAKNLVALSPDVFEFRLLKQTGLPAFVSKRAPYERFVLVHPFWSKDAIGRLAKSDDFGGVTMAIDTFQASRRPQRVVELCRSGEFTSIAN